MLAKVKKYIKTLFGKEGSVVAKATAWFLICSILQKTLRMITMPIFNRIMSVEEIGQYTNYTTWLEIIIIITTFRLDYGVFNKGMAKYPDRRNEYTSTMILTTSGLAAFWLAVYLVFHDFINGFTGLSTPITVALFSELLVAPAVWFWSLSQRYEYKYKAVVAVTFISSVVNTAVSIVAVCLCNNKVDARIYSGLAVTILFAVVIYFICLQKSKHKFSFELLKFAVVFNIPLIPHYFSAYILEQSDKIMIREMVGMKELGLYGTACSLASTIKIITTSMTNAILPWQYEALKEKKFVEIEKRIMMSVYLVAGIILLFICVAPEALMILASKKYMDAIFVIPPIACSVIMIFYYCLVANIEFFYDRNKFVTIISCICSLINVGINYFGVKTFGYLGAAYATYICYLMFVFAHVIYANKVVGDIEGIKLFRLSNVVVLSVITTFLMLTMTTLYKYSMLRLGLLVMIVFIALIFNKKILGLINKVSGK